MVIGIRPGLLPRLRRCPFLRWRVEEPNQLHAGTEEIALPPLVVDRAALGDEHPSVAVAHNNYGIALAHMGQQQEARAELEAGLEILEASLGADHPRVGRALSNLGSFTLGQGAVSTAQRYIEQAVAILSAAQGKEHPETLKVRASWAESLRRGGQLDRAIAEASWAMSDGESVELTVNGRPLQ